MLSDALLGTTSASLWRFPSLSTIWMTEWATFRGIFKNLHNSTKITRGNALGVNEVGNGRRTPLHCCPKKRSRLFQTNEPLECGLQLSWSRRSNRLTWSFAGVRKYPGPWSLLSDWSVSTMHTRWLASEKGAVVRVGPLHFMCFSWGNAVICFGARILLLHFDWLTFAVFSLIQVCTTETLLPAFSTPMRWVMFWRAYGCVFFKYSCVDLKKELQWKISGDRKWINFCEALGSEVLSHPWLELRGGSPWGV